MKEYGAIFQDIFQDFFEKKSKEKKVEEHKDIKWEEVGATKFRSIVDEIKDGRSLVVAREVKSGIRLSVVSGNRGFFVVDSLSRDVVTAERRVLLAGENEVRLNRWAREGEYDDNCAINFIGNR